MITCLSPAARRPRQRRVDALDDELQPGVALDDSFLRPMREHEDRHPEPGSSPQPSATSCIVRPTIAAPALRNVCSTRAVSAGSGPTAESVSPTSTSAAAAALAEADVDPIARPGDVAVERHRDRCHHLAHLHSSLLGRIGLRAQSGIHRTATSSPWATATSKPGLQLEHLLLDLAGKARPRVAFLPMAVADSGERTELFLEAFRNRDCEPEVVTLFGMPSGRWNAWPLRTSSTSTAATRPTCSRSGACTGSTGRCERALGSVQGR